MGALQVKKMESDFSIDFDFYKIIEPTQVSINEAYLNIITEILKGIILREPTEDDFKEVKLITKSLSFKEVYFKDNFIGTIKFAISNNPKVAFNLDFEPEK